MSEIDWWDGGDDDEAWGGEKGWLFVGNANATDLDKKYVQIINFVVVHAFAFIVIQCEKFLVVH